MPARAIRGLSLRAALNSRYSYLMIDTSAFKYFIYTRKSTDESDRQVRSLGDQAADIADIIAKRQLRVVGRFEENG